MDKFAAKNAVKALALGDRIVFTQHAKKRDPARGKFPLTREQVKELPHSWRHYGRSRSRHERAGRLEDANDKTARSGKA
jgi:hypothetical protein